jgi:tetratricopeptide (TPR) repeat protein
MNEQQSFHEIVRVAFQAGLESEHDPDEYHFVDDDDFLIDLSLGEINDTQRAGFVEHLARCSYCRHDLAKMFQADVLQLPETSSKPDLAWTESSSIEPAELIAARDLDRRDSRRFLFAAAASVLFLSGVSLLYWPRANNLALAQRELASGQYLSAMDYAETYLQSSDKDTSKRDDAKQILQQAAYQQSVKSLSDGSFETVEKLSRRAEQAAGLSPGLANLKLQAMRRQESPSAWPAAGDLTRYGYRLDGRSLTKTMPQWNDTFKKILAGYERGIAEFPSDVDLRLNYGQYLLERSDPESARAQFATAKELDPDSVEADLGLGIAAFQFDELDASVEQFQAVLARDSGNLQAMLNLAISLQRMGRTEEAISWFTQLRERLPTGTQRDDIQRLIDER